MPLAAIRMTALLQGRVYARPVSLYHGKAQPHFLKKAKRLYSKLRRKGEKIRTCPLSEILSTVPWW
jgi:hypothetical protein